jgi:VWFA-related protein
MNSRMSRLFGIFADIISVLIFFLLLPAEVLAPVSAQSQEKIKPDLQYEVSVVLKLVQVFVTNSKGIPITDLTASDFEVWDNGYLIKITDFEKPQPVAKPSKPGLQESARKAAVPTPTPVPKLARKFYLVFDFFRNDAPGIKRARNAALSFVDKLQPTDEIALLLFSANRGMILREPLTTDHNRIIKAIETVKDVPYFASLIARSTGDASLPLPGEDDRLATEDSEDETELGGQAGRDTRIVWGAADLERIVFNFIGSLTDLAKALRSVPGFKNVVLYSAGLSYALVYGKSTQSFSRSINMGDYGNDPETNIAFAQGLMKGKTGSLFLEPFQAMIKEFASANCPLYAVNTEGNRSMINTRRLRGMDSLKNFSEQTGGQYFSDADYREVIADSVDNITRSFYTLGYPVKETWDGRFHELEVKVKRPGLQVHAQRGYFSPKPFRELSDFEKRLQLFDLVLSEDEVSGSSGIVPTTALQVGGGALENCLFLCGIPVGPIRSIAGSKFEILQVVLDAQHTIVAGRRADVNMSTMPSKDGCFYESFTLKPGSYLCRTVVRNLETGEAAVGSAPVTISELYASELNLFYPLLLLPDKPGYYVRISEERKASRSIHDLFPFLAEKSQPVLDTLDAKEQAIQAMLRFSAPQLSSADILISAWVMNRKTGESIRLDHKMISAKKDYQDMIVLLELSMPVLVPDTYEIWVSLKDTQTGKEARSSRILKII